MSIEFFGVVEIFDEALRALWLLGTVFAAAGMQVYIVWGTVSVPFAMALPFLNQIQALPQNGAEKNYLEYLFPKPEYLVACLYAANTCMMGTSHRASVVVVLASQLTRLGCRKCSGVR